jgi:hypothetical protein
MWWKEGGQIRFGLYVFETCDGLVNFPCVRQIQLRTSAAHSAFKNNFRLAFEIKAIIITLSNLITLPFFRTLI